MDWLTDEMRAAIASGPQEAWTITGTCSDGGPFISRHRVGGPESRPFRTSDELMTYQQNRAARMNDLGASVRLAHERIGDDCLWHEVEE